ncbi:MAG TPA: hypothetical protein PLQ73_12340 [Planctomycetota bacterium]|jgi:hypothetical protein|nr:MAG: hypothetical protein BWX69_01677 [Planctomycetes bacterium ADurb.Bin069]HQC03136.1 hypothetical protein [Planctomycetota bacterium]
MPRALLSFLNEVAEKTPCPLSLDDIAALSRAHLGCEVDRALLERGVARSARFARTRKNLFATREVLFAGARLRIQPDPWEISRGILVPGHRFLPLWWGADARRAALELPDGTTAPAVTLRLSFERALSFHYLLGYSWIAGMAQNGTREIVREEGAFTAFNLRGFYDSTGFRPGDFLLLEIAQPWERRAAVRRERREEVLMGLDKVRAADLALERAIHSIVDAPHVLWSIPEQIFHAYACAPASIRRTPGSPLEDFIRRTRSLCLQEVGHELAVFPRGTTPFQLALRRSRSEPMERDPFGDPVDDLLRHLGINLRSGSVRGLLKLGASEGRTLAEITGRIIPWKTIARRGRAEARALRAELRKLWSAAVRAQRACPLAPDIALLFRRASTLKATVRGILRKLELLQIDAQQLPSRPLMRVVEIDELADFILQLDDDAGGNVGTLAELDDLLSDLEQNLLLLQEEILREAVV